MSKLFWVLAVLMLATLLFLPPALAVQPAGF